MTKTNKTAKSVVFSTIARRKTPITVSALADRTGLNVGTVKSSVRALSAEGQVSVVGQQYTGHRPANLYLAAA